MLDEQVRAALLASGQASAHQLDQWQGRALALRQPLYSVAIEEGLPEAALVSALSTSLGIPSVSLSAFRGKPELFAHVPAEVAARTRALPIGLKVRDGVETLFVAMCDPLDMDALEEVALHTELPIVALLAGAADLAAAIERVAPNAPPALPPVSRGTAPARPMSLSLEDLDDVPLELEDSNIPLADAVAEQSASYLQVGGASSAYQQVGESSSGFHEVGDGDDDRAMFDAFADSLPSADAGDMLSALSMLDDIPRDRHEVETSPSGFGSVPALSDSELPELVGSTPGGLDRSESLLPRNKQPSFSFEDAGGSGARHPAGGGMDRGETGIGRPTGGSGLFGQQLPPQMAGWENAPPGDLVRALVGLLLRRGLITPAELAEALEEFS